MSAILEPQTVDEADVDRADVDAAWRVELRRRIEEIRSGDVQLLTWEESRNRIRAVLDEMRER